MLHPLLTITTDISFDHTDILGSTLAQIASEKAGIIKAEVPHLSGLVPAEASVILKKKAKLVGTKYQTISSRDFKADKTKLLLDYRSDNMKISHLAPSLKGTHQLINAALVIKAASILNTNRFPLSKRAIIHGIKSTDWPGRFQIVEKKGQPTLILDVCHNVGGSRAFADTFRRMFPHRKADIIAGFVKKKEHQKMIDELAPVAARFTLVPMKTHRSVELAEFIKEMDWHGVEIIPSGSLRSALATAKKRQLSPQQTMPIAIIGSHYLVGEFLEGFIRS